MEIILPFLAKLTACSIKKLKGKEAYSWCTAIKPGMVPGIPTDPTPILNACLVSPKSASIVLKSLKIIFFVLKPSIFRLFVLSLIRFFCSGLLLFLDNIRMHEDENSMKKASPEKTATSEIVQKLAPLIDVYVTDAFAAAHRNSPSLTGFSEVVPCIAGRLMAKEIDNLQIAVNDPPRPYIAILGGTKCDDSLRVAKNLIDKEIIDSIPVVGVVGNMMLWASGVDIGEGNKSFIRNTLGDAFEETWEMAVYLHDNHSEYFLLPADVAVELNGDRVAMMVDDLPTGNPIYDIGIQTLQEISPLLINAGCILWNGPASYFELPGFAFGTIEILNMCIESSAVTIVGGGHTSSLVSNRGAVDQVTHNSTGGGACLTMLSGGFMPVIDSLNRSNTKFRPILDALGIKK